MSLTPRGDTLSYHVLTDVYVTECKMTARGNSQIEN